MKTVAYIPLESEANLVVYYNGQIYPFSLSGKLMWTIGRKTPEGNPDIPIASPLVSRRHGTLTNLNGTWYYKDTDSLNGTFVNGVKLPRSSDAVILKHGTILRIDNDDLDDVDKRGVLILFLEKEISGNWRSYDLQNKNCIIGRNPVSAQIVIDRPYISATHAKITWRNGHYYLRDMNSRIGTVVNDEKITGEVELRERDSFDIGDKFFIFSNGSLIYNETVSGLVSGSAGAAGNAPAFADDGYAEKLKKAPVILHAEIKTKKVKNNSGHGMKELIRDVNLDIKQGSLVALLGTAGAGKSTVMNCLNGMDLIGVEGSVMFKDVDLMTDFDQMSYLIGSVPQKKIFHPTFTPEEEFRFAAIMRLPGDTRKDEIKTVVDRTIRMLGMENVRTNKNVKLSGGEQTRVNVGIELVADRELLCLDEPDAGLSPDLKHELFMILRRLAHEHGKSILTIIHDVSEIDMFDQMILMVKADNVGRLAFSGTPAEARDYFKCDVRDIYAKVSKNPEKFVRRRM